jgi:hypothetical protein
MRTIYLLVAGAVVLASLAIWLATAPEPALRSLDSGPRLKGSASRLAGDDPLQPAPVGPQPVPSPPPASAEATQFPPPAPTLPSGLTSRLRKEFGKKVKTGIQEDLASADFYQALSPERKSQLVDLLADNELGFLENANRLAQQGKILSQEEFVSLRNDMEARIKGLLNEKEYSDYQQHVSATPDRNLVSQTTERLGRPLPEQAAQSLLAILAEERQQLGRSAPASKEESVRAMAEMAERVKVRANGVLQSEEEREALQEVLDRLGRVRPKSVPSQ